MDIGRNGVLVYFVRSRLTEKNELQSYLFGWKVSDVETERIGRLTASDPLHGGLVTALDDLGCMRVPITYLSNFTLLFHSMLVQR